MKLTTKWKNELVSFTSYYKYSFTYESTNIIVQLGGNSSDIYRADLVPDMTVTQLLNEIGEDELFIEVKVKNGATNEPTE